MLKIKDDVYFVGAFNPNLRVFDIIMTTEYGTTYNAYLVVGEKIALIETVHNKFKDVLFDNIKEICSLEKIDYIILNHIEPDHSGSVADLVQINPDITVIATAAGIKNLKSITNLNFNEQIAKTGDKLDLGNGLELEFITAPNLHWPDSMFTYLPSRKIVFTCDVLGSHYCEPQVMDSKLTYPKAYEKALLEYYTAIFAPFKKFVLDGLDKLDKLDFDTACTSHGPVLQQELQKAISLYREWSAPVERGKNVAIFYVSAYGYTRELAKTIRDEIEAAGVKAKAYDIIKTDRKVLLDAVEGSTAIMFGSPTINRDALKPVWDLISSMDAITNKGKLCFIFGSYGWSGEACKALEERVKTLGLKLFGDSLRVVFKPSDEEIAKAKEIARQFVETI
jgi:flavorubredoxin